MDWIDHFLEYTAEINSPEIFRLWAAIGAVSGALERRVWIPGRNGMQLYPNMYILLVGPPASGKTQAIVPVKALWQATKELFISPDSMTRASMLDELEKASRQIIHSKGLLDYHSINIATDEIGTLLPAHDLEVLSVINKLYDCPSLYQETRRHLKKLTDIIRPHMMILAGSQPGFMSSILPDEAWSMGFTGRLQMIYSGDQRISDVLVDDIDEDYVERDNRRFQDLLAPIKAMCKLYGRTVWSAEATREFKLWSREGCPPRPSHTKLEHYTGRRALTAAKLTIISAVARSGGLEIDPWDVERARHWLLFAETLMPDIFRAMKNKSDGQVMEELHFALWEMYIKTGNKWIPGEVLWEFLNNRIPVDKVRRVIDAMLSAKMIKKKINEEMYIPLAKAGPNME